MRCLRCERMIPVSRPQKKLCIPCNYIEVRARYKAKRDAKKIKKKRIIETCPACEKTFEKRTKDQKFCNDECRIIMDNKRLNAKWANEKTSKKKSSSTKNHRRFDISREYFLIKKACREGGVFLKIP